MRPFEGMTPAQTATDAEWALSRMRGRSGVASVVPDCFPAVLRVMHSLEAMDQDSDRPVRWADVLPDYLRTGPTTFLHEDVGPYNTRDGVLTRAYVDRLMPLLARETATPDRAFYGIWKGHGGINSASSNTGFVIATAGPVNRLALAVARRRIRRRADRLAATTHDFIGSCAEAPWWGGRDMALMDGALNAIHALGGDDFGGGVTPLGPQLWWPADRAWFVGNEIDDAWTYLAGSRTLIDAVSDLAARGVFEAFEVSFDDRW